jgi:hypothetical protein
MCHVVSSVCCVFGTDWYPSPSSWLAISSYVHTSYTHDETTTTMAIDTSQTRVLEFVNDPSAGSPTETLLRLLLPLNG